MTSVTDPSVAVHVLGIRHHGPGSARSVLAELDRWRPAAVLVEAPADTTAALEWVGHADLVPPVALLGHRPDRPGSAVFAPFASFSPEWCALAWANRHGVPARAIDLPWSATLHDETDETDEADETGGAHEPDGSGTPRSDPIAALAGAAGRADPEGWWEDVVEHRGPHAFDAVAEAMVAVRAGLAVTGREARREAHMRRAIRAAVREVARDVAARDAGRLPGTTTDPVAGPARVVVVCGAWHVPALDPAHHAGLGVGAFPTARDDAATLRGLPRARVQVSWVPWTHRRLADPAYGAGVRSPGWYEHVFHRPGPEGVTRFVVDAARVQRAAGTSTSPDHLVSTIRLADALAALRDRPRPGLEEVLDALAAVTGSLDLVRDRLVVGHAVGSVPDDAPQSPLVRDVTATQRRLRLRPSDDERLVELDLRTPTGLDRSRLLHRLLALDVPWGHLEDGRGSTGTFRETWRLRWEPEYSVRLVERSGDGVTLTAAAGRRLRVRADATTDPAVHAGLVDAALLADLPEVVPALVQHLARSAATTHDIGRVVDALGPLARSLRYGDVRATAHDALAEVFDGLVTRVLVGFPASVRSLDDDGADEAVRRLGTIAAALALSEHPARGVRFDAVLRSLADPSTWSTVHPRVQGRATRLRVDRGDPGPTEPGTHGDPGWAVRRLGRALGPGVEPVDGARFLDGFLAGGGAVLVHDVGLRGVLDTWLCSLHADAFDAVVPLVRRTVSSFDPGERRRLGAIVAASEHHGGPDPDVTDRSSPDAARTLDPVRVEAVLATVRALLGVGGAR